MFRKSLFLWKPRSTVMQSTGSKYLRSLKPLIFVTGGLLLISQLNNVSNAGKGIKSDTPLLVDPVISI